MPRLRRTLAAVGAGAVVALAGVSAIPNTAQAAGVATGYRYLPATSNDSSSTLRYLVQEDGTLRRI